MRWKPALRSSFRVKPRLPHSTSAKWWIGYSPDEIKSLRLTGKRKKDLGIIYQIPGLFVGQLRNNQTAGLLLYSLVISLNSPEAHPTRLPICSI